MSEDIRILFGQHQSEIKLLASHLLLGGAGADHGSSLYSEDFEDDAVGSLPPDFNIEAGATAGWVVTDSESQEGTKALVSEDINDNENASVELTLTFEDAFTLSFYYRASSEDGFDVLNFYVNGVNKFTEGGDTAYQQYQETFSAGTYTFKWDYSKDGSVSSFNDAAYIDNISITVWDLAPSAPTGLNTTAKTDTTIDLAWDANSEPDLDGYNVYVDGVKENGALIGTNSYQITGLTESTSYNLTVTAVNDEGQESDPSAVLTESTTGSTTNDYSLALDGAGDYGEVPHDAVLNGMSELYISARFKLTDNGQNFSTTFRTITSKGTHSTQDYGLIVHSQDPNNPTVSWITFIVNDNLGNTIRIQTGNPTLWNQNGDQAANDVWNKVEVKIDGAGSQILLNDVVMDLYQQDETPLGDTGPGLANPVQAFTNPLRIGWDGGSDRYFPGNLDEIQIWNNITNGEANEDTILEGNETGLLFYANFEQNDGTVNDQSTNNNNGTLQGNAVIELDADSL